MATARISPPLGAPVTLDEVKAHLRIEHADEDAYLESMIAAATAHLEAVTGRKLLTQVWRQYLDGPPPDGLVRLAVEPVRAIVAVRIYDGEGVSREVPLEGMELDRISSPPRLVFSQALQPGKALNGIEIDIEAGHGEAAIDLPDVLRRALLLLVAHAYEFRGAVPLADQPASEPAGFRTLIAPFRRMAL